VEQSVFLVECYTASATAERAEQMLARLSELPGRGTVVPVSCIAVPSDEMCLCLVEGDSAESVHQALTRISIGHERIVEAVAVNLVPSAPAR
jgi:hypothetical protein